MIVSIIAFAVSLIFLNYTIKNRTPSPKYSYADFPEKFKIRHFTKYGYSRERAKEILKLDYIEKADIYYNEVLISVGFTPKQRTETINKLKENYLYHIIKKTKAK